MNPTRNVALVPTDEQPEALSESPRVVSMFERLAADPNVDVTKLEKLMEMQERALALTAKAAFNAAFAEMQGEIPAILERGKTNNGKYAPLEDIVEGVRPILQRHGFALSHKTEWMDAQTVKVVGILAHRQGHERTSEFLSAADGSGNKNAIQGLGSAISYGRRYTTKDLLNIVTRGEDDDGATAGRKAPEPPAGYQDWLDDMECVAGEGTEKLRAAWQASKPAYREYLTKHGGNAAANLKAKAGKVQR